MNISLIKRIEKIEKKRIEKIGNKSYLTRGNETLRVINPEDYLEISANDNQCETLYVIVPKLVSHPLGIIAEEIIENVSFAPLLDSEQFKMKGIFGSAVYRDRTILVINLYELFEEAEPEKYRPQSCARARARTVLLVEDSPFFRKVELQYLERGGYRVILASNGREALETLQREKVDIVLSDIQMPILDGYELLKKIRQNKNYNDLPVIALTSRTGKENRAKGLESGFDRYEYKLDREKLLDTLDEILNEKGGGDRLA